MRYPFLEHIEQLHLLIHVLVGGYRGGNSTLYLTAWQWHAASCQLFSWSLSSDMIQVLRRTRRYMADGVCRRCLIAIEDEWVSWKWYVSPHSLEWINKPSDSPYHLQYSMQHYFVHSITREFTNKECARLYLASGILWTRSLHSCVESLLLNVCSFETKCFVRECSKVY